MMLLLLFFALAVFVGLEIPIGFALALSAVTYLLVEQTVPMTVVVQRMAPGLDSFPLLAIPLFILAGNLLNRAGIADRIFAFALALVGHIRGGLAHVNVVASVIFAGMSGVAQADAAGLGTVEIKAMRGAGFTAPFSAAVTAASAIIGPIIPPSVIMVIYAVMAQVPLSDLFLAGILPGIGIALLLMAMIYFLAATGRITAPVAPRPPLGLLWRSFLRALPALAAPIFLVAGMLVGAATPTELGAIIVVYAIVLGFANRELTLKDLMACFVDSLLASGVLVFIIAAAVPFGWVVAINNLPVHLTEIMLGISREPWVVLLMINVLLLIAGAFMETTAILLIAVPALLPVLIALDINLVHFGLVVVFNLLLGAITPPFGIILFIMMDIAKVSFREIVRAILPFYIPLGIALLLITYWPALSLWLPQLVSGR